MMLTMWLRTRSIINRQAIAVSGAKAALFSRTMSSSGKLDLTVLETEQRSRMGTLSRWEGRVALVTGASSGIGAAIARRLVMVGMKVVGVARRIDKLEEIAKELEKEKGKLYTQKCDLSSEEEIRGLFNWVEEHSELGKVDACINNAGFPSASTLSQGSMKEWKAMMDVNVLALCLCTQLSVESMKRHNIDDGQIVMMSSFAGHRVGPNPSIRFYAATKYAVNALIEGWRVELRDANTNIRVAGISPGLVETDFHSFLYPDDPAKAKAICSQFPCIQSDDIAESVLHVLAAPKHVQVHDILLRPTQQRY